MAHLQTPGNESPGYYVPAEGASNQTTGRNFYLLEETREASTHTAEEVLIQLITPQDASTLTPEDDFRVFEESSVTSANTEDNRKRKISSQQKIRHISDVKSPRTEICRKSDSDIPTLREKICINPDSRTNIVSTSRQISFESSPLLSSNTKFSNPEEIVSENLEVKVLDSVSNSQYLKVEQNTASYKNTFHEEDAAREITFSDVSKVKNLILVDIPAVAGPSSSRKYLSQSNACVGKFQNRSPLKSKHLVETDQGHSLCLFCKEKSISEHVEVHEEEYIYKCCQCKYKSKIEGSITTHIFNHPTMPFYCDVCQLSYSEKGSHGRDQICNVCKERFECKIQLENHYSSHKQYLEIFCRICDNKIDEHLTISETGKIYECCHSNCTFESNLKFNLKVHLYIHSALNIFKCEMCEMSFKQKHNKQDHMRTCHPSCPLCSERFLNSYFLDRHICNYNDI